MYDLKELQTIKGRVYRQTEKAWLLEQDTAKAWVAKSQASDVKVVDGITELKIPFWLLIKLDGITTEWVPRTIEERITIDADRHLKRYPTFDKLRFLEWFLALPGDTQRALMEKPMTSRVQTMRSKTLDHLLPL